MHEYRATLSSALEYAQDGGIEEWIHLFLNGEGRNRAFSDGLKLLPRHYLGPARFPIELFHRCAGPEENMPYRINADAWERSIREICGRAARDDDMPPLIVHYIQGQFELSDGNHRYEAYRRLGFPTVWVIIWITEEDELDDFIGRYEAFLYSGR